MIVDPYLTASEMGRLAAGVFFFLSAAAYANEDMPFGVTVAYFTATFVLYTISGDPYLTWILDRSDAKWLGFGVAVVAGVASWVLIYRSIDSRTDHSPTNPEPDEAHE